MTDLSPRLSHASLLLREGNRMAAVALLRTAVAVDPLDLTAHRRLAAVLANSGDLQGAFDEHARYREFLRARGDLAALQKEVAYAAATLGEVTRPRLLGESREPSVRLRESRSTRLRQRVRLLVLLVNGLLVLIVWAIGPPAPEAEEAALTTPTPTALSTVPFALTAAPSPTPSVPSITQTPKPPTASMPVAGPTVVLVAPSPSATVAPTATGTTSSVLAMPSPAPTADTTPASSIGAHGLTERDAHSNAVGKPNTNAHSANVWPDRSDADPDPGGRHRRV